MRIVLKILAVAMILIGTISLPAYAKDDYFTPAFGEAVTDIAGLERTLVTAEGGLNLYSYQGKLLPGFPVLVENYVFASSPIFANISGDEQNEIIAVARNADSYSLFAFDGTGAQLGSAQLAGEIYYDPVSISRTDGSFEDIAVANTAGRIARYRYEGGAFTETVIANTGSATGLSVNGEKNVLILNFPETNGLKTYSWQNGELALERNINLAHKIIYPVKDGGNGVWYGINNAGTLVVFNPLTGSVAGGFPLNMPSMPISTPEIVDLDDSNAGDEIVIRLSDGKFVVVSQQGNILNSINQNQNFTDSSTMAKDDSGVFSGKKDYGTVIISRIKTLMFSLLTRIGSSFVPITFPELDIKISSNLIENGGNYDLGTYDTAEQFGFKLRIENNGTGLLALNGAPVELVGESADLCQVQSQPSATIISRSFKEAAINCQYNDAGDKTIEIRVSSNDQNEGLYVVLPKVKIVVNKVQDGIMEAAGIDKWIKWGTPTVMEKSVSIFKNGTRSMRISILGSNSGFQQRFVAVEANKIYKFSFNYRLASGQMKVLLGINDSNADFENRMAILRDQGEWYTYSREFKVPANFAGDFRVAFITMSGESFVDDVRIEEIAKFTPVADGDMEYPVMDKWIKWGTPTIFEKNTAIYRNGKRSMRIAASGGNAGVQQRFLAVEAGKNYRFSLNYRIVRGQLKALLGINDSNADFENKMAIFSSIGQWNSYTREFHVPDNFAGDFRIAIISNNGEAYIDDVKIEEIAAMPIITDGNMEMAGVGAWIDWGTVILKEKDAVEKHAGSYSLHLRTGDSASIKLGGTQQIGINSVVPGKSYTFSFWYKNTRGTLLPRLGIGSSNNDFELVMGNLPSLKAPSNGWQFYTRTFTVPANFAGDFRMVFAMYNLEIAPDGTRTILDYAETWLDDIEIKAVN